MLILFHDFHEVSHPFSDSIVRICPFNFPSSRTWFSCEATLPIYVRVAWLIGTFISHLPAEEISMLAGLVLCFFGGMYPLTLAAAEALRQCGK